MPLSTRRRVHGGGGLEAWPGYVDALSTLLMVIIFVLLVFVLAQAFLSVALSGRDQALDRMTRQMSELSDMLSLERGRTADLRQTIAGLGRDLAAATAARDSLTQQLSTLQDQAKQLTGQRDALSAERDRLSARLADDALQAQASSAQIASLQSRIADAAGKTDTTAQAAATTAAALAAAQKQLSDMRAQMAELDRTVTADRATIEARLSDLAKLAEQVRALTALRDQLEQQARTASAQSLTEQQKRQAMALQLQDEQKFSDSAKAQIALLNQQVTELRSQLAALAATLDASEKSAKDKDVQIANLGQRLNAALASKVEELQQYRSEFFGKLRAVLANRPGIQVVGDRFVFQSEVLFPTNSADLTAAGTEEISQLAGTLKQIASEIPKDLPWILRVDGHADRQPVVHSEFADNWQLSAARAITVVKLLIADGIPPQHLAATAFSDFQPLDAAATPEAYAKNRRIELRLTDR